MYITCTSSSNTFRAKLYNKKRFAEKVEMKKKLVSHSFYSYVLFFSVPLCSHYCLTSSRLNCTYRIKLHEKKEAKNKKEDVVPKGAVPAYLLDRYISESACMCAYQLKCYVSMLVLY